MSRIRNERGTALLLAMTLVLMLAAAAAAAALTARMETLLAGSFKQSKEAVFVAEGALARAIQDLSPLANWSGALAGAPSTFTDGGSMGVKPLPGGGAVVLCCGPGSLTEDLQQRAYGGARWGANTPQWRPFAWGNASTWLPSGRAPSAFYLVVWIADDVQDGDGDPLVDSNGAIVVHALALGPARARRSVRAIIQHARRADGTPIGRGVSVVTSRESRW